MRLKVYYLAMITLSASSSTSQACSVLTDVASLSRDYKRILPDKAGMEQLQSKLGYENYGALLDRLASLKIIDIERKKHWKANVGTLFLSSLIGQNVRLIGTYIISKSNKSEGYLVEFPSNSCGGGKILRLDGNLDIKKSPVLIEGRIFKGGSKIIGVGFYSSGFKIVDAKKLEEGSDALDRSSKEFGLLAR